MALLPVRRKVLRGLVHLPADCPPMEKVAVRTAETCPLLTRSSRALEVTSPVNFWVTEQPDELQFMSPEPSMVKSMPRSPAFLSCLVWSSRVSNIASTASPRTGMMSMPSGLPTVSGPRVTSGIVSGASPSLSRSVNSWKS